MCTTCDIIRGKCLPPGGFIFQNEYAILHHCLNISIPGYLILSPIRHVNSYADLTLKELTAIDLILKQSVCILKQLDEVQKLYICSFGEETNHFHWHIFPRRMEVDFNEQVIDGAKYFSEARKKYKVLEHEMLTSEKILRVVSYLQQRIKIDNGLRAEDRRTIER